MSQEMRDLINKFNQIINENVGEVEESGYSSVARTLRGIRPSIKKIAILTAENPHNEKHSKEYNREANFKLEKFLTEGKYGFKKVKGLYDEESDDEENSFIVFNISLDSAIGLGARFKQDSIIYGETKNLTEDGEIGMSFKMIGTDKIKKKNYRKELESTDVFINRNKAERFYSRIGNKKFVLPFYDVVDKLIDKEGKVFNLTKDYTGSNWEGGKVKPTSVEIDYDVKKEMEELENSLNDLAEDSMKAYGYGGYNLRSRIKKLLRG